ncbi:MULTISPECIES: hypothetical protein [unclassified Aquimarina]|uniref:hypothetical protein n=1 Tax=unclassified Aquimarina TaxID=2627091 RepID=UPI00131F22FA|nr:hypothetical protein [Aquimarina sp. Aq107]
MKCIYAMIILVFCTACSGNDDDEQSVTTIPFLFEDGFETQGDDIDELFVSDGSRWTNLQRTNPSNEISIATTTFSEGQNSIRLLALPSDNILSKMDIEKEGFRAFSGDVIIIEADFYLNTTVNIENLLLIDLECCSCWDPSVVGDPSTDSENQCPGVRLMMSGGNDFLSIERGKISGSTLEQTTFSFPRNEWVSVRWELTLSDTDTGINKLFINGDEVITRNAMNMPNPEVFRDVFAENGIEFNLQEPVFYERVQVGVTANPTSENIELFVDDFSITIN